MSQDKHTRGPYKLDSEDVYIFGPRGEMIAELRGHGGKLPIHANGLLLAASWDMLEALERVLSLTPEDSQVHKIAEFAVRQAR